jgi:hypothetical protein
MFFAALFTIAKLWKKPIGPTTGEWTMKMWYLCTMELYSATKKMKFCHSLVNRWNGKTSY